MPICVNVTSAAVGNPWGRGLDRMQASHIILPAENDA
jgi:hypothetical protein